MERIEECQPQGVVGRGPVGIGEHEDIAVRQRPGCRVHVEIGPVEILEVQQPVVDEIFMILRREKMRLHHEITFEADIRLGGVKGTETGVVYRFPEHRCKISHIYAGFADDPPRGGATADHSAVVHQEHIAARGQSLPFGTVDRHPGKLDRAGGDSRQLVGLLEVRDRNHVVAEKSGFNSRPRL